MRKIMQLLVFIAGAIIIPAKTQICLAQNAIGDSLSKGIKSEHFQPIVILEVWGTYSMGEEKNGITYADRFDVSLRRLRFGAKGSACSWLKYNFTMHADLLGEDPYASTKGSYKGIGIWNAYITAKLLKSGELLNLHAGYYWASISREYNTSPWAVSSFDKTYSVWYLRNFLTATGNGISSGIGLGGLMNGDKNMGVSYRFGMHYPEKHVSAKSANPLLSGRVMFSIGDPEQQQYDYMLSGNQWRKRKGITFGLGGAYQGKTDNKMQGSDSIFFDKSFAFGSDLLINFIGLTVESEYFLMKRTAAVYPSFNGAEWHVRVSYNIAVGTYFFEPVFMISSYEGTGEKKLYNYIGNDIMYDTGINWYVNKDKIKLAAHYVIQDGTASCARGNYAGLSLQVKI